MAKILLAWEFGSGMGHLMTLCSLGAALAKRGHQVTAVVRNLPRANELFAHTGISCMAAPMRPYPELLPFPTIHSMAHVLGNVGFANGQHLYEQLSAWTALIERIQPDLVIADYAPTALLALRGKPIRKVNVGVGFSCPPDTSPMPYWGTQLNGAGLGEQIRADEAKMLACINQVLENLKRPALERVSQIFNDVDEVFLATYPEFDHYGPRQTVRYWGHWNLGTGARPDWPKVQGAKVFAYVKPFPGLELLLRILAEAKLPTIMLASDIPLPLQQRYASPILRFESDLLDMRRVAAECDLAILNAGHGTTLTMLMAAKPCLLIPLFIEQVITAKKAEGFGAARLVSKTGNGLLEALRDLLELPKYPTNARIFASRCAGFPIDRQVIEVVNHLEKLAIMDN